MIQLTTAYHKISELTKKHRVIQGGQGGSKTFSILIKFLEISLKSSVSKKITIVSDTYPTLKDGAISDMETICKSIGLNWSLIYNGTEKNLRINNTLIQFRNVDGHNFEQMKGVRRDYLFVNEATKVKLSTLDQMLTRSKVVYYDFNPDSEFWIHTDIVPRRDAEIITLTYLDNELLSDEERTEIEMRIEASKLPDATNKLINWVNIYAYGQIGTYSDRQIYSYNFIDNIPEIAKRIPSGMDFGVSPDPTILIDMWQDGVNLYIDEVFCENNLMPEKINGAERMSVYDKMIEVKHIKGQLTIGDNSGATTIRDLRTRGFNIVGVKGKSVKGSQIEGIRDVRGYNLFITKRSINLKNGLEKWYFKVDSNGKIIPEPNGHEPDGLAALRYVVMMKHHW